MMAQVGRLKQHSTKFGQSRFVTATQPKYRVNCEWCEVVSEVCEVRYFGPATPRPTPQIFVLKFLVRTSGPKQT